MLITVHLLIVTVFHYTNQQSYVVLLWKRSTWCRVAGSFFLMSLLASTISIVLLSIDRVIFIVIKPFQRFGLSNTQTVVSAVCSWSMCLVFAILIGCFSFTDIRNSLCIFVGKSITTPFSALLVFLYTSSFLVSVSTLSSVLALSLSDLFRNFFLA